jgi:hypothetical protein
MMSPRLTVKLTETAWAHRAHDSADITTLSGICLRSRVTSPPSAVLGTRQPCFTSGSLTWGAELNEGPDMSHTMPFPKENIIITVYGGCPSVGEAPCI